MRQVSLLAAEIINKNKMHQHVKYVKLPYDLDMDSGQGQKGINLRGSVIIVTPHNRQSGSQLGTDVRCLAMDLYF